MDPPETVIDEPSGEWATCLYLVMDHSTGEAVVSSAGHLPVLVHTPHYPPTVTDHGTGTPQPAPPNRRTNPDADSSSSALSARAGVYGATATAKRATVRRPR
jgi:hypothetical protein